MPLQAHPGSAVRQLRSRRCQASAHPRLRSSLCLSCQSGNEDVLSLLRIELESRESLSENCKGAIRHGKDVEESRDRLRTRRTRPISIAKVKFDVDILESYSIWIQNRACQHPYGPTMGFATSSELWIMGYGVVMRFPREQGRWTPQKYGLEGIMGYQDYGLFGLRL